MVVIGLGLLGLMAFVALAEAARDGKAAARAGVLIEAAILLPLAWVAVAFAVELRALGCDESCDENLSPDVRSGDWWHTQDAWQWSGQVAIAGIGAVAVVAAFAAATRARYRAATALLVLAATSFGVWAALLAPLGNRLGI
jgi:hypothetical protein